MPVGFEDIQRQELSRLFGRIVGARLFLIPVGLAIAGLVAFLEPARWRAVYLFAVVLPVGTFFAVEVVRFRRGGLRPSAVPANLLGTMAAQVALALATGALESPLTYTFLPLAFLIGLFASRRVHAALVTAQVAAVAGLLAVELAGVVPDLNLELFGGGPRAGHVGVHLVVTAVMLSGILIVSSRIGAAVRQHFDRMLRQALEARDASLRAHADRAEELTALSAEIAHELKNPLASVKGLAALLADAPAAPRSAERLAVLRREVDRMGGVLDEFLNFSRPLVPLTVRTVDLAELAEEVAALHEGMARERGVAVAAGGGPAPAACDPRKVRQILMNLVQNAIEASGAGAAVELVAGTDGRSATVEVLDRGAGVDAAVEVRAFEAGVTTKARGSGLGLTIARALARQHGGEVTLGPRAGGGCAARLVLPAAAREATA